MRKLLISSVGVLSLFVVAGQAMADEFRAPPKRERAAARHGPPQQAPQQQASNWSGGQVGGFERRPAPWTTASSNRARSIISDAALIVPNTVLVQRTQDKLHHRRFSRIPRPGGNVGGRCGRTSTGSGARPPTRRTRLRPGLATSSSPDRRSQGADGSIRGRLGYLVTPWTLLYATRVLAIGQVSGSFSYAGCTTATCSSVGPTSPERRLGATHGSAERSASGEKPRCGRA